MNYDYKLYIKKKKKKHVLNKYYEINVNFFFFWKCLFSG